MKIIIFDENPQTNFIFVNFNEYDEAIRSYNTAIFFVFTESNKIISISFIAFNIVSQANSLFFEIINFLIRFHSIDVKIIKINFDKRFILNKRAYMQKEKEFS